METANFAPECSPYDGPTGSKLAFPRALACTTCALDPGVATVPHRRGRTQVPPAGRENSSRCSEQSRRKTVTQSHGTKARALATSRSEEHTSELQSPDHLVCRLLLEKK